MRHLLDTSVVPRRTPLHCAASCNSVHLCKMLVESGAAIFATTISDVETAADKCEEMEDGYTQCSQFLYGRCYQDGVLASKCWLEEKKTNSSHGRLD